MLAFPAAQPMDKRNDHRLDRWLRFSPAVAERYLAEHRQSRIAELRSAIVVGLILYNTYNVTDAMLQPDILAIALVLRIGVITVTSLALMWVIGRTSPVWTERLVLIAISNAFLLPLFLFLLSTSPNSILTFPELGLTVVYANMLLALRFRHAAVFTTFAVVVTAIGLTLKGGLAPEIQFASLVQILTACLFSLYANYRMEQRRCLDYLETLGASLRAESAEIAQKKVEGLSRTDTLTRLPNRRHLEERMDEWFKSAKSIAVLMIDVDHFKLYNDTLGHPAGDDCLQQIGAMFADKCSGPDRFCARFGGEEFTVLLRDTNDIRAVSLAEKLLNGVRELAIPTRRDRTDCPP